MRTLLKYGTRTIPFDLPNAADVFQITEPEIKITPAEFRTRLGDELERLKPDLSDVSVVLSDKTRLSQYPTYLPVLLETLESFGADSAQITLFIAYGTHQRQTDEDGQLLYEIEAEYAEQQENRDIEMQNVRIRYSTGANVPWIINADLATINDDHDLLRLSGHVIAVSNEGFSGQVTEIRSEVLDIDPIMYKAETDERVQLRIGSRSLTGTGMLALLQENRLELRANVSGKFIP